VSRPAVTPERWELLSSYSDGFTCYSAALGTWAASAGRPWRSLIDPGVRLTLTEEDQDLFGFAYFRADLRADLGLMRTGAPTSAAAVAGVLEEVGRQGRVIVAGDGFNLPWHVAHGRVHAPHWFVVGEVAEGLELADPFACRNELGTQRCTRLAVTPEALPELLPALPGDDPVHRLREVLAFGDASTEALELPYQWFVERAVGDWRAPAGSEGPAAVRRLAEHFRARGADLAAYRQADDIWSIARHRAFLCRHAVECAQAGGEERLSSWVTEHALPLAKRWGHIAPLLMQAVLSLRAGRTPSGSVPDTLEQLAGMEAAACAALPSR
jgi:hypothetical protein